MPSSMQKRFLTDIKCRILSEAVSPICLKSYDPRETIPRKRMTQHIHARSSHQKFVPAKGQAPSPSPLLSYAGQSRKLAFDRKWSTPHPYADSMWGITEVELQDLASLKKAQNQAMRAMNILSTSNTSLEHTKRTVHWHKPACLIHP